MLDLFAPTRCLACRRRASPPWCAACRRAATAAPPGCTRCADPWPGHDCPLVGTPVDRTLARWAWDGPVRAVVAGAKSRGAWAGWASLADDLVDLVRPHLSATAGSATGDRGAGGRADGARPTVTAVPAAGAVVRRRGIDHAAVLAARLADHLDLPRARLLGTVGRPTDQGRAGGRARRSDRRGDLAPTGPAPPHVVLVDDVLTTGATVRAAAEGLGAAGAKRVTVVVVARAGALAAGASVRHRPVVRA